MVRIWWFVKRLFRLELIQIKKSLHFLCRIAKHCGIAFDFLDHY